jgi:hypothetical protein
MQLKVLSQAQVVARRVRKARVRARPALLSPLRTKASTSTSLTAPVRLRRSILIKAQLLEVSPKRCPRPGHLFPSTWPTSTLASLSNTLCHEEALYRELARARPEAFTPDLAGSLNTLATSLSELGRREEALAISEERKRLLANVRAAAVDSSGLSLAVK